MTLHRQRKRVPACMSPFMPRALTDGILHEWLKEVPEASRYIDRVQLRGESVPRLCCTHAGLGAFRRWLASPPASPVEFQMVTLLYAVTLSDLAGLLPSDAECTRLARPYRPGETE